MLDNGPAAEGSSFHERPVHQRSRSGQGQTGKRSGHLLVGIGGPAAIHPVRSQQQAFLRRNLFRLGCQGGKNLTDSLFQCISSQSRQGPQRPFQDASEHRIDIPETGLSGFHSHHAREDGSVHLPQDTPDATVSYLLIRGYYHVAGRGTDYTHERSRLDLGADRAHVGIEGTGRYDRRFLQAQPGRPFRAQVSHRRIGRDRRTVITEADQIRVQFPEEVLRRKTAPAGVPERLVAGRTPAPDNPVGIGHTGQQSGNPVTMLDNGVGCPGDFGTGPHAVQGLRPKPFAAVDPAFVHRIIQIQGLAEGIDFVCLLHGGMVLPQDEHGIRILSELRLERQRNTGPVRKDRGRSRRIKGDAHNLGGDSGRAGAKRLPHRRFERFQIIQRMLAPLVGGGVAVQPFRPAGIFFDGRGKDLSRPGIHDQGTDRIRAEVESDYILVSHIPPFPNSLRSRAGSRPQRKSTSTFVKRLRM